jgi:hypothetical protein
VSGRRWALLALSLVPSAVVYRRILRNYFLGDDFRHLWEIADWGFLPFVLGPHGGHVYLVRNLVFYACAALFGFDPRPYFVLVLATHLVNVALLFLVLSELGSDAALAAFGATLWGVLPLHEGTLGWYSVYGQVLSATVLLAFLRRVCRAANGTAELGPRRAVAWCLVLLAGETCFGTGLSVALVAGVLAFLLLPPSRLRLGVVAVLCSLLALAPLLYVSLVSLYAHFWDGGEPFAALPANPRRAAPLVADMLVGLVENGVAGALVPYACGGANAPAACTLVARVFGVAVLAAVVVLAGVTRRRLLAWIVLLLAVYGLIALGRAPIAWSLHKTTAQMAATARYHYVATIPVVLLLCGILDRLRPLVAGRPWLEPALLAAWTGVVGVLWLRAPGIDHHDAERAETAELLATVHTLVDASPPGADVYVPNRTFAGVGFSGATRRTFPGWAAIFMITEPANVVRGRRVHFVESDPAVIDAYRAWPERRTASLLVGPDEVRRPVPSP